MSELLDILRCNEARTFIRNAEIVREYPDCPERADAAREQVHRAMYRSALGQVTEDERVQILAILRPCCPDMFSLESAQDNPYGTRVFLHNAEDCSVRVATNVP
jgi:hypothetical protein